MEALIPKLLIFTFGTRGDVQPYVALGKALKARGFDVTICTGQGFDDFIEGHGLASSPVSINYRELLQDPQIQEAMDTFSGKLRAWKLMRSRVRQQHDEMLEIAREVKPDLMISNAKGYVAHTIARAMGIPSIPSMLQPLFVETAEFPPAIFPGFTFGRWGNRLAHKLINSLTHWMVSKTAANWAREVFGAEEAHAIGRYIGGYHPTGKTVPVLHGYSANIVPTPGDWDARQHITGYWFLEPDASWTPPADLQSFIEAGEPPVYVGFGSMPSRDAKKLTEAVYAALDRLGRRGVLATGWGGLAAGQQSSNIFVIDHAPHDWLLPRCAAIVHHGGSGTTHEGLRWGRPTVICPAGVDQPFWGSRVAKLGAGPEPVALKSVTADKLAPAISFALTPEALARAEAVGEAIRREMGAAKAADLVCAMLEPAKASKSERVMAGHP